MIESLYICVYSKINLIISIEYFKDQFIQIFINKHSNIAIRMSNIEIR